MSVQSVNLLEVNGGINSQGEREYQKIYQVITTDPKDGPLVAQEAAGIERYGDPYTHFTESDKGALAFDIRAQLFNRQESRVDWRILVNFATWSVELTTARMSLDNSGKKIDDPLKRAVEWSGSFITQLKRVYRDANDKPLLNTAGELLEDVFEERRTLELIARKNFSVLDLSVWTEYSGGGGEGVVNSDEIWGLKPDTVKVVNIGWSTRRTGLNRYFEVEFRFEIKPTKWNPRKFPNLGWMERVPTTEGIIRIRDDSDFPTAGLWWLDADGVKMTPADIRAAAATPTVKYPMHQRKPFSKLNLPKKIEA